MDVAAREAEEYAAEHTTPMSPLLEELERFTLTTAAYPSMLTGRVEGRFLQTVAQLAGARDIVDIGTFRGYSALTMAETLPPDGMLVTIEHNPDYARIAQGFFDRSPHGSRITIRVGEAEEILKTLPDGRTDLVFIMPTNGITRHITGNRCGLFGAESSGTDRVRVRIITEIPEPLGIVRGGGMETGDSAEP